MAFMDTENASSSSSSFPSSSSTPGWKYDVFLSFRGTDTRKNFTDHLYAALSQKGIFTFRDDEKLERGTFIAPELLSAIEDSRFAVVILSRDYASSSWCLIELAKIVECMEKKGLIVLPVFHYVDPSDVRNQRGAFAEAFVKHEERFKDKIEDVYTWRAALTQVASIAGWDLHDKHEAKVIEEMVRKILGKLNSTYSVVHKDLVGINSRMEEMVNLLAIGLNDVRFVGICGMGGMGKTTLARLIYNKLHYCFEGSSFLANVREESKKHGLVPLQKQLLADIFLEKNIDFLDVQWGINMIGKRLCHKRVLVILDDVDQLDQLEALAGERNWFGQGSRIIITTRYQHLLIRHEVVKVEIYKARKLNDDEALHFFSLKAFKKDYPSEGYEVLSQKVICYAQGLPLALEVLGRFLFRRSVDEWESALCRLKESPERQISDVLKITFDGLREREKNIFLDIACFFKGMEEDHVVNILQALYDKPKIDIVVLLEKSLITISFGKFWMHDLLQELGKEIVRCESPEEPGRRSRLWLTEDVIHVLKCNTGKEVVKSIFLDLPPRKEERLNAEAFSKMKNLRLLKISNVHFPQGLKYLSSELRFIHWDGYPLESMPTSFEPEKLVELIMPCSLVKGLWKGIKSLERLKLIDLRDSWNLIETPDFTEVPNLEQLILQHCTRLSKIHSSLGELKRLILLDLNGCKCLKSLPHKISLESLKVFILSGCSRLKTFPEIVGNMSCLLELYLDGTAIEELPLSVERLTGLIKLDLSGSAIREWSCTFPSNNLKILSLSGCEALLSKSSNRFFNFPLMPRKSICPMGMLQRSLSGLWSLTQLDLSYCNLQAIPDVLGCLSSLTELYLMGNNFIGLPKSIIRLSNLEFLFLSGCTFLRSLPELPINIGYILAEGCTSLETLPLRPEDSFKPYLSLFNCVKLIDNQGYDDMLLTMLRHYFQVSLSLSLSVLNILIFVFQGNFKETSGYDMIIPGSKIPKWFSHHSEGASLNLQVPSLLCNKLMGIVLCVVFALREHHPLDLIDSANWGFLRITHQLTCTFKVNGYDKSNKKDYCFSEQYGKIELNHLWLSYVPPPYFNQVEELIQIDANGFNQIEFEFETFGPGLEIKKCGVHLVFKENIEDCNQTMAPCRNSNIIPYEDEFVDSAKDSRNKRRHGHDGYDGAGPSEESSFNDLPHPKRIRLPNIIERFVPRLGNLIGNLSTQDDFDDEKSQ